MAKASELPTEIWLLIGRYLTRSQLSQLRKLNSFFLNLWMDITWRQVMIDTEFPPRAIRSLLRMVDPFVAARTKRLAVCLRHFKTRKPPSSSSFSRLTSILLPKPKPPPTFQAVVTLLLRSLPLLPHITSLKIELWHIPLALVPALFQTITTSPMAQTIQKLWLSGHIDMFASFSEYPPSNLTDLNLELINCQLHDDVSLAPTNSPNRILSLALFVLSLSPSLQLLRIWNWTTTLDLSLFFSHLSQPQSTFPNLHSLLLILPFNTSLQSSPQSLHRFLLAHSNTLQHLQLRLKMSRAHLDPAMEEPLGTWLSDLVHDRPSLFFPSLQTLDLYPSSTPTGLSAVLTIIKRTISTLSSLTIRDRYLTREEAQQVLDVFTQDAVQSKTCTLSTRKQDPIQLKSLRMNITHLAVPFLCLLAHTLPQLQKLWLNVSEIVASDQSSFYNSWFMSTQDDCLRTWKLRTFAVWQGGQKVDDVVRAVMDVVPSVVLDSEDDVESEDDE